jgi:hypothetical protein
MLSTEVILRIGQSLQRTDRGVQREYPSHSLIVVAAALNVLGAKPGLVEFLEKQNDDLRCGGHDRDGARAIS